MNILDASLSKNRVKPCGTTTFLYWREIHPETIKFYVNDPWEEDDQRIELSWEQIKKSLNGCISNILMNKMKKDLGFE